MTNTSNARRAATFISIAIMASVAMHITAKPAFAAIPQDEVVKIEKQEKQAVTPTFETRQNIFLDATCKRWSCQPIATAPQMAA